MPMIKSPFNGQLNSNELFGSIYNMIISQYIFAENVKGGYNELVDMFRVDGSLYGDTKLFYATDALKSRPWGNDAEAGNLLAINRPKDPECQAIVLDTFRQIDITVDNYLSKRAWSTEGAFSNFNSVVLGWLYETKRVYDQTLINSYVGTVEADLPDPSLQDVEVLISEITADTTTVDQEAKNRLVAQLIAEKLANVLDDMKDISRNYNDYGFIRSFNEDDLIVVWNNKYVNKIRKLDVPTIFNNQNLVDKFGEYRLPSRYFGTINVTGGTVGQGGLTGDVRSLIETDYVVSETTTHVFPGDKIPTGAVVADNTTYTVDEDIICKIIHREGIKFMSAFQVGTSFFNARSLTENHYLTWGYGLDRLKNYPIVVLHED